MAKDKLTVEVDAVKSFDASPMLRFGSYSEEQLKRMISEEHERCKSLPSWDAAAQAEPEYV